MPALAQALNGVLPDAAVRQLMQAVGNCQQTLSHRGAVQLGNEMRTLPNGTARSGAWNPSQYSHLLPDAGDGGFVDVPNPGSHSYYNNYNNTVNNNRNSFEFPLNSEFNTNYFYGGDTLTVFGDTRLGDLITNNATITNLNVTNLYQGGRDGRDGADGADGASGAAGRDGRDGLGDIDPTTLGRLLGRIDKKTIVTNVRAAEHVIKVPTVSRVEYQSNSIPVKFVEWDKTNIDLTVNGRGYVSVPTSASLTKFSGTASGSVDMPTSASLSGITATCSVDAPIPTAASLSGLALACSAITVPTYTGVTLPAFKATCDPISVPSSCAVTADGVATITGASAKSSAVTFSIPTAVTLPAFTGSSSAINVPTSASVAAGAQATLTIQEVTGGSLDANCNLVLTTAPKTYTITLPALTVNLTTTPTTPTITVAPAAAATLATTSTSVTPTITLTAGTVTLPSLTAKLTAANVTPVVSVVPSGAATLTEGSKAVTPTVSVTDYGKVTLSAPSSTACKGTVAVTSHGTINLATTPQPLAVTLAAADATIELTPTEMPVDVESLGTAYYHKLADASVDPANDDLALTVEEANVTIDLTNALNVSKDFLIYYRPRF